jgi:hypothetical protein
MKMDSKTLHNFFDNEVDILEKEKKYKKELKYHCKHFPSICDIEELVGMMEYIEHLKSERENYLRELTQ